MSKLFTELRFPIRWIITPAIILYCSTLAYTNSPIPVNLVTLAINSIINGLWIINLIEICFCGCVCFSLTMSMALLRYKELIYLIRVNKVAGLIKVSHLYNQLVIDIEDVSSSNRSTNRYYVSELSIPYRFLLSSYSRWQLVWKNFGCNWFINYMYY